MPPKFSEEINALFRPRPKPKFLEPIEMPPPKKLIPTMSIMNYILQNQLNPPESDPSLPPSEIRIEKRKKAIQENQEKIAEMKTKYHPFEDPKATKNPQNTLFISNLPPQITKERILREFSPFGQIDNINLIERKGKLKSYGFIEYRDHRGAVNAMNHKDHQIIDGYKLIIDLERARTVPNWLPRRLGGGIGDSRPFQLSRKAIECQMPPRKKKSTWKSGKRYNFVLDDVRRKREERSGKPQSRGKRKTK